MLCRGTCQTEGAESAGKAGLVANTVLWICTTCLPAQKNAGSRLFLHLLDGKRVLLVRIHVAILAIGRLDCMPVARDPSLPQGGSHPLPVMHRFVTELITIGTRTAASSYGIRLGDVKHMLHSLYVTLFKT